MVGTTIRSGVDIILVSAHPTAKLSPRFNTCCRLVVSNDFDCGLWKMELTGLCADMNLSMDRRKLLTLYQMRPRIFPAFLYLSLNLCQVHAARLPASYSLSPQYFHAHHLSFLPPLPTSLYPSELQRYSQVWRV